MWKVCGIILLAMCAIVIEAVNAQRESDDEELVYVQAIWRHGDRAPTHLPYPNDEYNETVWPRGWGQITNVRISLSPILLLFLQNKNFIALNYLSNDN